MSTPPGTRLLFLTPQLPSPTRQGAAIRNWNLMVELAKTYQIDLLTFADPGEEDLAPPQGAAAVPWQRLVRVPTPRRTALRRLKVLLTTSHPDMADRLWSAPYLRQLSALLARERYDIVQAEGLELARYLLLIARYRLPDYNPLLVFDDHNAEWLLQRRAAWTDLRRPRRWPVALYSAIQQRRLRRFEARTLEAADLTVCVSAADAATLQPLAPDRPLIVAPNGVDTTYYSPARIPRERPRFDVIFSGTLDYRPNIDAVVWFVTEVWPIVTHPAERRGRVPRLALIGRNPPQEVTRLVLNQGVTVTGSVADDRPYFAGATVYALPMRYGGGSRLKLLNALAMGCAVVSTTAGAEGVEVRHEQHLLIADGAADFAAAIARLLTDEELRSRLGAAGQAFVREEYDWAGIVERLRQGYAAALAARQEAANMPATPLTASDGLPPTEPMEPKPASSPTVPELQ
jgi:glycosyltransferase involved in cell wall biosynthesis